jgi:PiT family inorganic phosphate transporter
VIELILLYTAFIFGYNNSGIITGVIVSSGFLYKRAIIIPITGFILGFYIEGSKMADVLLDISNIDQSIQFIITSIILTIFSLLGLPISMVNVLIGAHIGLALYNNTFINIDNLIDIIISWLITPFIAIVASILLYILLTNILKRLSLLTINRFYMIVMPLLTFYTSYALAANNIGLLHSNSLLLLPIAASLGIVRSKKTTLFVSEQIVGHSQATIFSSLLASSLLLWIFTQFAIPLSLAQLLLASLFGVNLYRKPMIYNKTRMFMLIASWIGSTILSLSLAYFATFLLDSL